MSDYWAHFGDGNSAEILEIREYTKIKTGVRYVKFIFLPSKRIEQMYNTREKQDPSGAIVMEYPKTQVEFLERGVGRIRCWIFTDFMGNGTRVSDRYNQLTMTIEDTERLLHSSEAARARSYQELDVERQHKKQAIKLQSDIIREVAKARGRTDEDAFGGMMGEMPPQEN